jgi:hypothetical protein
MAGVRIKQGVNDGLILCKIVTSLLVINGVLGTVFRGDFGHGDCQMSMEKFPYPTNEHCHEEKVSTKHLRVIRISTLFSLRLASQNVTASSLSLMYRKGSVTAKTPFTTCASFPIPQIVMKTTNLIPTVKGRKAIVKSTRKKNASIFTSTTIMKVKILKSQYQERLLIN